MNATNTNKSNMKNVLLSLLLALCWVPTKAQSEGFQVWTDESVEITADGETATVLTFYEKDSVAYCGFNFSLVVPAGVKLAKHTVGRGDEENWVELTARAANHTIASNQPNTTLIKVISYSPNNHDYYSDDEDGNPLDAICTVGLIADPEMYNGTYTIELTGCKFVTSKNVAVVPPSSIYIPLTITGGRSTSGVEYTLPESGYGTLILPFDAELPADLQAYTCTGVSGTEVILSQQLSIEANTPLLIVGTPGTYTFDGSNIWNADSYTSGVLTGVYTTTEITSGYVLQADNGMVSFVRVDAESPATIAPNRCYLSLTEGAESLSLSFGDITGLGAVTRDGQTSPIYDLNGRRADAKRPGTYISNKKAQLLK
jgi:hypothetical protein